MYIDEGNNKFFITQQTIISEFVYDGSRNSRVHSDNVDRQSGWALSQGHHQAQGGHPGGLRRRANRGRETG